MKGFFYSEKEIKAQSNCNKCRLHLNCKSPKMQPTGYGRKKILIIGEAPGITEDKNNKHFIGESGKLLRAIFKNNGVIFGRDCIMTNAVICKPKNNNTPTNNQIKLCRQNLLDTINKFKPDKVFCFGLVALQSLLGHKLSITSIKKYVGLKIPDQEYRCWIYPNYHPSFLIKNHKDKALQIYFSNTIKEAIEHNETFFTNEKNIRILNNPLDIKGALNYINQIEKEIIFDYETTGLKPYKEGHEIICCSIATKKETIAFPFLMQDKEFISLFKKIMLNENIKKIAQNIKFESLWTKHILGIEIKNWYWDTMIASHIIDNRTGITGLKFQTYVNFGETGYDKEIKPYLVSNNMYGFNKIKEFPLDKTLEYCALDSYWEYKLYKKQQKELKEKQGYDLFLNGSIELEKIEDNGIHVNIKYYKEEYVLLDKKIKQLKERLRNSEETKTWNSKEKTKFNYNSSPQLKKLLFNYLNYKSVKETTTGQPSTDHESLEKINTPFVKNILKLRKTQKLNNTYISNFIEKSFNGYLHPSFNLHIPKTYRSSSDNPNFQNIPSREEEAKTILRKGIIPKPGNLLLEVDYNRIEVGVSACYHQDPVMLDYIYDYNSDMHRDMGSEIFIIPKEEVTKSLRYLSKNGFVFPQFYGDYYIHCANNIWDKGGIEVKKVLRKSGIKNIFQFQEHMKAVENHFWGERFKVYGNWKDEFYDDYLSKGCIEMKTGFICRGIMNKKDVCNYPIQGSAFHILLWSLIQLNRYMQNNNFKSKIIGQIHDSVIFDIVPEELKDMKKIIHKIMCIDVKKYWDWIIIPLSVEIEITEINGSWYTKKEIDI